MAENCVQCAAPRTGGRFCNTCGNQFGAKQAGFIEKALKPKEAPASGAAPAALPEGPLFCKSCTGPVDGTSKFCKMCGARVTVDSVSTTMPGMTPAAPAPAATAGAAAPVAANGTPAGAAAPATGSSNATAGGTTTTTGTTDASASGSAGAAPAASSGTAPAAGGSTGTTTAASGSSGSNNAGGSTAGTGSSSGSGAGTSGSSGSGGGDASGGGGKRQSYLDMAKLKVYGAQVFTGEVGEAGGGFLFKLGGKIKLQWQQRYVEIKDYNNNPVYPQLVWSETKGGGQKGFLDLREAVVRTPAAEIGGSKDPTLTFSVIQFLEGAKPYHFAAPSQDLLYQWLFALRSKAMSVPYPLPNQASGAVRPVSVGGTGPSSGGGNAIVKLNPAPPANSGVEAHIAKLTAATGFTYTFDPNAEAILEDIQKVVEEHFPDEERNAIMGHKFFKSKFDIKAIIYGSYIPSIIKGICDGIATMGACFKDTFLRATSERHMVFKVYYGRAGHRGTDYYVDFNRGVMEVNLWTMSFNTENSVGQCMILDSGLAMLIELSHWDLKNGDIPLDARSDIELTLSKRDKGLLAISSAVGIGDFTFEADWRQCIANLESDDVNDYRWKLGHIAQDSYLGALADGVKDFCRDEAQRQAFADLTPNRVVRFKISDYALGKDGRHDSQYARVDFKDGDVIIYVNQKYVCATAAIIRDGFGQRLKADVTMWERQGGNTMPLVARQDIKEKEAVRDRNLGKINTATGQKYKVEVNFLGLRGELASDKLSAYGDQLGTVIYEYYLNRIADAVDRVCGDAARRDAFVKITAERKIVFTINNPIADDRNNVYSQINFQMGTMQVRLPLEHFGTHGDAMAADLEKDIAKGEALM